MDYLCLFIHMQQGYGGTGAHQIGSWGELSRIMFSRIFRLFWIPPPPQKSLPKSSDQKNTCQNFPTQKISRNQKFQTPKNPSIIPVTWNPENPYREAKFTILETFCSGMKTILDLHVGLLLITHNKCDFCNGAKLWSTNLIVESHISDTM